MSFFHVFFILIKTETCSNSKFINNLVQILGAIPYDHQMIMHTFLGNFWSFLAMRHLNDQ